MTLLNFYLFVRFRLPEAYEHDEKEKKARPLDSIMYRLCVCGLSPTSIKMPSTNFTVQKHAGRVVDCSLVFCRPTV